MAAHHGSCSESESSSSELNDLERLGYHGSISGPEAKKRLAKDGRGGGFLVRDSDTVEGAYCLSVQYKGTVKEYNILPSPETQRLYIQGEVSPTHTYPDLGQLLETCVETESGSAFICPLAFRVNTGGSGKPEVWVAAEAGDVRALRECCVRGDDPNVRGGKYSSTPLMEASRSGSVPAARLVLAHGGDVYLGDEDQRTALHWCALSNHPSVCDLLVTRGAGVNMVSTYGRTPLMYAAGSDVREPTARVLLEQGADCGVRSGSLTALDLTEGLDNTAVNRLLTDPSVWRSNYSSMTDAGLTESLETSERNIQYKMLLLNNNSLTIVPEISKYDFFNEITVLNLANNQITQAPGEIFPVSAESIYLEGNQIEVLHPFSRCRKLKRLHVHNNNIQSITGVPQVSDLSMYGNPCVLDWSYKALTETQLEKKILSLGEGYKYKVLLLNDNSLKSLPPIFKCTALKNIQIFDLKYNSIEKISKENLSSSFHYDLVVASLSADQISNLRQPPPQVFRRGYRSVELYFKDLGETQVTQQAENSKKRLIFSGPSTSGKTSLVRTLIAKSSSLTHIKDRTQVLDIKSWKISDQDVYQIFDHGGHPIYSITNPLFLSNQALIFVTHNLGCIENMLPNTMQDLKQILHQDPGLDLHFLLTHVDELEESSLATKLTDFQQSVSSLLSQEIDTLSRLLGSVQEQEMAHLQNVLECYKSKMVECKYFPVSSLSCSGISELTAFLTQRAADKRVTLPKQWVKFYKLIVNCDKKFIMLDEGKRLFKKTYSTLGKLVTGKKSQNDNFLNCLRYFKDCGLLLWYEENEQLRSYIFHEIEFVIDVFKSLFHHDLEESIDYETSRVLQGLFLELEYKRAIESYQYEGILSSTFLGFLWEKYQLSSVDQTALISLIMSFKLCYEITESTKKEIKYFFFPWFVGEKNFPSQLDPKYPMLASHEIISLHLECIFHNSIPANVTEILSVELQKLAVSKHYLGGRYAWNDGLMVNINKMEIFVYRYEPYSSVNICVRGKIEKLIQMWMNLEWLYLAMKVIIAKLVGAIRSLRMRCSHCKHKKIDPPHFWLPSEVFPCYRDAMLTTMCCPKEPDEEIPVGLINIIRDDFENKGQCVKDVEAYLSRSTLKEKGQQEVQSDVPECYDFLEKILHSEPLITELYTAGVLQDDDKHQLKSLVVTKQCRYLVDKLVVKGGSELKDQFVAALNRTRYYTNMTAARILDQLTTHTEWDVELITEAEMGEMKTKCYKALLERMDPERLTDHLYVDGTVDQYHYAELQARPTTLHKATYLLDSVLFRGTITTVSNFRAALIQCNKPDLAGLLPTRATAGEFCSLVGVKRQKVTQQNLCSMGGTTGIIL